MFHKKFGADRFSRFDVYWIQTNKQTNRQTDKPNLYIDLKRAKYVNYLLDLQEMKRIKKGNVYVYTWRVCLCNI